MRLRSVLLIFAFLMTVVPIPFQGQDLEVTKRAVLRESPSKTSSKLASLLEGELLHAVDLNTTNGYYQTGAVYKLAASTKIASRPIGQWNNYEIAARGNSITVNLNNETVCDLKNGKRPLEGYIGLQNHHPGSRVQFRHLRIKVV
jgi:Domain of Unknown Function (DUF1080)